MKTAVQVVIELLRTGSITNEDAKVLLDEIYSKNNNNFYPYYPFKYDYGFSPYKITCSDNSGNYTNLTNETISAFQ